MFAGERGQKIEPVGIAYYYVIGIIKVSTHFRGSFSLSLASATDRITAPGDSRVEQLRPWRSEVKPEDLLGIRWNILPTEQLDRCALMPPGPKLSDASMNRTYPCLRVSGFVQQQRQPDAAKVAWLRG